MIAGRLQEGLEAGQRALSIFEARGNRWWAGRTLWHLTSIANYLGDWKASLGYCRRGLEHGIALQDLRLKVVGWTRMGLAHIQHGDIERGLECCDEALALAPIARDNAWARVVRGHGKIKAGQLDDGIAELAQALAWFESSHMRWTHIIGTDWLAAGYLRRGDRTAARPLIDYVLETSRATGYLQYEGRGCWLMAECLAAEAPEVAEDYADHALRIFEQIGARNDLAKAMVARATLHHNAGEAKTARQLFEQARGIFQTLGTRGEFGRIDAALARLGGA
jgi:tetratricopeptide (TPR) repeat protein